MGRTANPVKGKIRSSFVIQTPLFEWWAGHVPEGERSLWIERRIQEAKDNEKRTPAEIRLNNVLTEWHEVSHNLEKLRAKIDDEKQAATHERRLAEIAALLLEVYPDLTGNWNLIREHANIDLRQKPEWAKEMEIRKIDLAEAITQAEEVDRLIRDNARLESEYDALSTEMAGDLKTVI